MACPLCERTGAYLDGELPLAERTAHEAHLSRCSECARELSRLQRLSRFLSAARVVEADPLRRVRKALQSRQSVLRLAEVLTAAAALVMAVCGLWLFRFSTTPRAPKAAPAWEQLAMSPQGDVGGTNEPEDPMVQALLQGQP